MRKRFPKSRRLNWKKKGTLNSIQNKFMPDGNTAHIQNKLEETKTNNTRLDHAGRK